MDASLNEILQYASEKKGSDVHLSVGVQPVIRINGNLHWMDVGTLSPEILEKYAKEMIPKHNWDTFTEKGEIDFSYSLSGVSRFRVNAYRQRGCISIAIRLVPSDIPSLDSLHMPEILKKVSYKTRGLILVTGPTGSGKSTTLAAMIDYMNQNTSRHIITLEDPIEYLHRHGKCIIDQREVGADTKNFANGFRASLRQDPDVIMVGELRDLETISTAITAAETGHLVLGTLHTTDAPSTINRIIDVFPPNQQVQIRIQLASVLVAVISQRLLPVIYDRGRRAAYEILINNAATSNLIRNEKIYQLQNVMQTSRSQGMMTMAMTVKHLLDDGIITREIANPFLQGDL